MTEGPHQEQLRRLPQQARSRSDLIGFWTRRLSYLLKLAESATTDEIAKRANTSVGGLYRFSLIS